MLVWDQGVWHRVSFRSSKILKTFQSGKLPNRPCWLNSVTFLQYFFISKCLFISLFIYQSSLKSVLSILTNKCGWPSIPNSRPKSKLKSNYKPNIIWVLAVSWITDFTYALINSKCHFSNIKVNMSTLLWLVSTWLTRRKYGNFWWNDLN